MGKGQIVAGCIAPHPPHLVYAENPPQNELLRKVAGNNFVGGTNDSGLSLSEHDYDAIVLLSPHWQTYVGTHFLGLPHFEGLSVDPIFPNLFRYHYDMNVDVELAQAIHDEAAKAGLPVKMMENPDFRVDYGTITTGHLFNPDWDKPLVVISGNLRSTAYYSVEVMQEIMIGLGRVTEKPLRPAEKESWSRQQFTLTPTLHNRIRSARRHEQGAHHQPRHAPWDMRMIDYMRSGQAQAHPR